MIWYLAVFAAGVASGVVATITILAIAFAAGKPTPPMDREAATGLPMRLINADALKQRVEVYAKHGYDLYQRENGKAFMKMIDRAPTIPTRSTTLTAGQIDAEVDEYERYGGSE